MAGEAGEEPILVESYSQPATGDRTNQTHSGLWRTDRGFEHVEGLKITMRHARGVTADEVLMVPLRFQVPPIGDFTRQWAFNWAKFTTLRRGEKSRPQGPTLDALTIDTMLLDGVAQDDAGFSVVWPHQPNPQRLLRELRWIMGKTEGSTAQPFFLTITQPAVWDAPLVSGIYVLSTLTATQKAGEVGTEYVTLSFEEYDEFEVNRRRRGARADKKHTHRLADGDTLYGLARRYWRAPSLWRFIADANGIKRVSPHDADELKKWAAKHHRKTLEVPPKPELTARYKPGTASGAGF